MGGLLYKDFVAIRGKRFVWILVFLTIIFTALRMIFPGSTIFFDMGAIMENGEIMNFMDVYFFLGEFLMIWMGCYYTNDLATKILQYDQKDKIRGYLFSMPVKKSTYVASKYIFIGITAYVFFSFYEIWHIISLSTMCDEQAINSSYVIASFAIPFLCFTLFVTAIELPMFFLMGKEKAKMIKVGFVLFISFLVLWFLLFGDLSLLENWDLENLVNWVDAHGFLLTFLSIISPVITVAFSYVSYRITVFFYGRRECFEE